MRILFVCGYYKPAYSYGGPVNSIASLCECLVHTGNKVTVLATNANGNTYLPVSLGECISVDDVPVRYFPLFWKGLSFFFSAAQARAVISHIKDFDIVVAEGLWGFQLIAAAVCSLLHHKPYIVTIRGQLNPWAIARKGLKKKIYLNLIARYFLNRAAGIMCQTKGESDVVRNLGFKAPNIIVPSGLDTSFFANQQLSNNYRHIFGIPDEAIVMLFLGRLTPIKRPDIAVETLAVVQSIGSDVHLIFAGPDEGGMTSKLAALAEYLGCGAKIHFAGLLNRNEVRSILANVDLLLMPTEIQENFGNSALEALAAGVPVLVSRNVPIGGWVEHINAGQSIPCTKEDFQKAAIELLHQPGQLKEMGNRGRIMVQDNFDIEIVTRQMIAQYQAIIETGHPLPSIA
jgi:glycosyltransferase involved in cell wall biosynthesis